MQPRKIGVVLLALLLAGMAMVPMVSAEKIVPAKAVVGMDYLSDISAQTKMQPVSPTTISEYSLVTADSKAFMKNADNAKKMDCTVEGQKYSIELTPVPSIIAPNAKLYIKTNEGTTVAEIPPVKQYKGRIIGEKSGDAFFTVDDKVVLGRITIGNNSYFIDQFGTQDDGKIVHIVYNAKNEIIQKRLPSGNDILPITASSGIVPVPEKIRCQRHSLPCR